jgi:uncharacterized protein
VEFEWDETKNKGNFQKHGVWFEEAQTAWSDKASLEFYDPEHSHDEDRFIRIGHSTASRLLLVIFCEREEGNVVRIISARNATLKEKKEYEEGIRS